MKKVILIVIVMLMSAGCGTPKMATTTDVQRDSVAVVIKESIIYRDTVVFVEVPAEADKAILPDTDTSRLETSLAVSEAWVTSGKLNHTLKHKPEAKIKKTIPVPEKNTHKDSIAVSEREVIKEIPVEVEKELTSWQTFRMVLGSITLVILAIFILWKIVRIYILR